MHQRKICVNVSDVVSQIMHCQLNFMHVVKKFQYHVRTEVVLVVLNLQLLGN